MGGGQSATTDWWDEDGAVWGRGCCSGAGRGVWASVAGPQGEAGAGGDCTGEARCGSFCRTECGNGRRNNAEGRSPDRGHNCRAG